MLSFLESKMKALTSASQPVVEKEDNIPKENIGDNNEEGNGIENKMNAGDADGAEQKTNAGDVKAKDATVKKGTEDALVKKTAEDATAKKAAEEALAKKAMLKKGTVQKKIRMKKIIILKRGMVQKKT